MSLVTLGEYLCHLRLEAGLTQTELAEQFAVNSKTIERWENGKHEPRLSTLYIYVKYLNGSFNHALALALDIENDELLSDEDMLYVIALIKRLTKK